MTERLSNAKRQQQELEDRLNHLEGRQEEVENLARNRRKHIDTGLRGILQDKKLFGLIDKLNQSYTAAGMTPYIIDLAEMNNNTLSVTPGGAFIVGYTSYSRIIHSEKSRYSFYKLLNIDDLSTQEETESLVANQEHVAQYGDCIRFDRTAFVCTGASGYSNQVKPGDMLAYQYEPYSKEKHTYPDTPFYDPHAFNDPFNKEKRKGVLGGFDYETLRISALASMAVLTNNLETELKRRRG